MLPAILTIGGIGLVAGIGLAVASKVFYVFVDPKIIALLDALPGANCGGCGFPGCSGAAEAIASGAAPSNICVGGGATVHVKVAEILGVTVVEREPDIARPGCTYGVEVADRKYDYDGFHDCRAAMLLSGGAKVCPVGCLGLGTCVRACPFGALSMEKDGLPSVKTNLCTGCGTCERVCPKHIITLTSSSSRVQHEYTTDECTAPCQRTCPAGIDIPAYIYEITRGNYRDAVRVIKEKNPLPLVCGRICLHPCEFQCRRNLIDEPVAINSLKRFVADYEMKSGERIAVTKAPATGKRIAVVGGGAEGLTTAYFLARLGHEPTVFEGREQLGGLLRTVIPDTRLPKDVLDWEIQGILDTGVQAMTAKSLGRDFTVDSLLKEGNSAVFIATGGWDSQLANGTRGEFKQSLPGVELLVRFTLDWISGVKHQSARKVMIVGGGNASIDAAKICLESGAEEVHVLFRGKRDETPFSMAELKAAEKEGIRFHFQCGLTKMMGEGSRLTHVEIGELCLDEEMPGRFTIRESSGKLLEVDRLLIGAGRFPELIYVEQASQDSEGPETGGPGVRWETVLPYGGPFAEGDIGIFRPGEVTSDYKAVVEAIGSGRRAAVSINKCLMGQKVEPPANMIRKSTYVIGVDQLDAVSNAPRQEMPELSAELRIENPSAEVELGFSQEQAMEEANRCLRCGLICYRRNQNASGAESA